MIRFGSQCAGRFHCAPALMGNPNHGKTQRDGPPPAMTTGGVALEWISHIHWTPIFPKTVLDPVKDSPARRSLEKPLLTLGVIAKKLILQGRLPVEPIPARPCRAHGHHIFLRNRKKYLTSQIERSIFRCHVEHKVRTWCLLTLLPAARFHPPMSTRL